jgi:hypothetical protein
MSVPACRHCRRPKVNRPRGLCYSCFYRPGVRELYPSTHPHARRGVPDFCREAALPPAPTAAPPGSPEKLAVLIERAAGGFACFHPGDGVRGLG